MAERHEIVFSGAFAGGGGATGGGGGDTPGVESDDVKQFNKLKDGIKENTSGFWKKIGIDVSIRSLLKQSQIFTSVVGGFFQIVGGFIDIVLTPFIPFIIPIMKKLSSMMPKMMEFSSVVGAVLGGIFKFLGKAFIWADNATGNIISTITKPMEGMIGYLVTIVGLLAMMSKSFRNMLKGGFNMLRGGTRQGHFSGGSYMGRGQGAPIGLMRGGLGIGGGLAGLASIGSGVGMMQSGNKTGGAMSALGGGMMAAGGVAAMTGVGMPVALGLMGVGAIISTLGQSMKENTEALKSNTNATVVKVETHNATLALDLQREGLQSIDDSALDVTVQRGE